MFKTQKWFTWVLLITLSAGFISSCGDDDDMMTEPTTITATAQANGDFTILVDALVRAGLDDDLADASASFTVFAPTDAAFNTFLSSAGYQSINDVPVAMLQSILLYHVVSGEVMSSALSTGYVNSISASPMDTDGDPMSLYVNTSNGVMINGGATVTTADVECSNGVIHIVNSVIALPTLATFATLDSNFSTLLAAVSTPGLTTNYVGILSDPMSQVTVFAPTNAAFGDLLTELGATGLGDIPLSDLEAVLNYHIVNGANVNAEDLADGTLVTTLGGSFTIDVTGGARITDNNSRVSNIIATDVQGNNGVIHAIDKVLRP